MSQVEKLDRSLETGASMNIGVVVCELNSIDDDNAPVTAT